MAQPIAVLLIEQLEDILKEVDALKLHIAKDQWETPEQREVLVALNHRYEQLAEELCLAITAFRK
jgi:hypothetical protein